MNARQYSSHAIPPGACYQGICAPFETYIWDWLHIAGVPWTQRTGYSGENLWLSPDLGDQEAEVANWAFGQSPSHFANATNPGWGYCGIGMIYVPWADGAHVVEVFW